MTSPLIVLRGNSGSGKSSVARALRERYGYGLAWVEQDRIICGEPYCVNMTLRAAKTLA